MLNLTPKIYFFLYQLNTLFLLRYACQAKTRISNVLKWYINPFADFDCIPTINNEIMERGNP